MPALAEAAEHASPAARAAQAPADQEPEQQDEQQERPEDHEQLHPRGGPLGEVAPVGRGQLGELLGDELAVGRVDRDLDQRGLAGAVGVDERREDRVLTQDGLPLDQVCFVVVFEAVPRDRPARTRVVEERDEHHPEQDDHQEPEHAPAAALRPAGLAVRLPVGPAALATPGGLSVRLLAGLALVGETRLRAIGPAVRFASGVGVRAEMIQRATLLPRPLRCRRASVILRERLAIPPPGGSHPAV